MWTSKFKFSFRGPHMPRRTTCDRSSIVYTDQWNSFVKLYDFIRFCLANWHQDNCHMIVISADY